MSQAASPSALGVVVGLLRLSFAVAVAVGAGWSSMLRPWRRSALHLVAVVATLVGMRWPASYCSVTA